MVRGRLFEGSPLKWLISQSKLRSSYLIIQESGVNEYALRKISTALLLLIKTTQIFGVSFAPSFISSPAAFRGNLWVPSLQEKLHEPVFLRLEPAHHNQAVKATTQQTFRLSERNELNGFSSELGSI